MKKSVLLFSAAAFVMSGALAPALAEGKSVALVLGVKGSPFYEALACGAKAKAKSSKKATAAAPTEGAKVE